MNLMQIFQNFSVGFTYFLAAVALSLFLTRILIVVLPPLHFVDIPHGRHKHDHPVPRGGGIAIIFSFFAVMAAYFINTPESVTFANSPLLKQFLLPMVAITILGIADDRYELSSIKKLVVHILIGVYFYCTGARIDCILGYSLPVYVALPVTVCWIIGIINAFNLIDGMDGVAAGLAMIAAVSLAVWFSISGEQLRLIVCLLVFCGSCLGFLHFNFSPARIFMGDTGSMFLGMFFAYFSIISSAKAATLSSLLVPVLAMGIPIFDVALAIIRRVYRRYILHDPNAGIMVGDHDHLHHRIQQRLKNTSKSAICLYALAILLVGGAMGAALLDNVLHTLSFGILLIVLFVMVRFATIEFFDAATLISDGISRPHKKFLITAFHPAVDFVLLMIAYLLTTSLFRQNLCFRPLALQPILCCIAPFTVILSLSGIYRTYWMRSSISRLCRLIEILFLSAVAGMALLFGLYFLENNMAAEKLLHMEQFYIAFAFAGSAFIVCERLALHYAESFLLQSLAANLINAKAPLHRTLLYGGGLYCRMFLISQYNSCRNSKPQRQVLGIIDDNLSLRHLNIFGMKVLGNSDELDQLLKKHRFTEIVITLRAIPDETRAKLIEFGKKNNICVQEFRTSMDVYNNVEPPAPAEKKKTAETAEKAEK